MQFIKVAALEAKKLKVNTLKQQQKVETKNNQNFTIPFIDNIFIFLTIQ